MPSSHATQPRVFLGTLMLGLSALGGLLAMGAGLDAFPDRLERFLQSNAAVWLLGCFILLVVSIRLLWDAGHVVTEWKPEAPGVRFNSIVVYTRPDCLLCEEAIEMLSLYRNWIPTITEVNVDEDDELKQKFGESVPVIEIDGKVRFRGALNEILFRRLIEASPPQPRLKHR